MKLHKKKIAQETEKGFALLYTLLVVTILLGLSSSIFTIFLSELKITSFSRNSEMAYYAAETGAECVYYWTLKGVAFDGTGTITCAGQTVAANPSVTLSFPAAGAPSAPCAVVTVGSNIIRSYGYNTCETTRLRVERGLEIILD